MELAEPTDWYIINYNKFIITNLRSVLYTIQQVLFQVFSILFLWSQLDFLHSMLFQTSTVLKPWTSHFILPTRERWPCTITQKKNRKKPLNYGNSTLTCPHAIYKLPGYLHPSFPPILQFQKAFLLPKVDHSTYKQDPCPFHLLRNLIMTGFFLSLQSS